MRCESLLQHSLFGSVINSLNRFHNKVSARQFSKYIVRGMDGVDQDKIIVGQDEKEKMDVSEDRIEHAHVLSKVGA